MTLVLLCTILFQVRFMGTWNFYKVMTMLGEVSWNSPKSMWKLYFSRDGICIFWNASKPKEFHFRFLFCFQIDHVLFLKCPIFPIWFWKWEFKKKMRMPSSEKYIIHILFGAFHNTSLICCNLNDIVQFFKLYSVLLPLKR